MTATPYCSFVPSSWGIAEQEELLLHHCRAQNTQQAPNDNRNL